VDIAIVALDEYMKAFTGNKDAYGVHVPAKAADEKGKKSGESFTKKENVREEHYLSHLKGENSLGIVPINADNKVTFSVLDVDVYKTNHTHIIKAIYDNAFPILPFRSKSGGLHLYIFYRTPVSAKDSVAVLHNFRSALGLPKNTETFPKQTILKPDQIGNWINLPYFNCYETERYLYDENGEPVPFEMALLKIKDSKTTIEECTDFMDTLPLYDAPPCLQALYITGCTNSRNMYLFSLAKYYKTKHGDDFEMAVLEANARLDKPLDVEEVVKTVISAHKKKEYGYKCKEEPICSICEKAKCKKREYGVGSGAVSDLSYEELRQYDTDPPYYEWIVNGKSLKFYTEMDIINQATFRSLSFRILHVLPNRLKDETWTRIVNQALTNVVIKSVDAGDDISPGAQLREYIVEYLTRRAPAINPSMILMDHVFKDDELKAYVFKGKNLVNFLVQQKRFYAFGQTEIQARIALMGAHPVRYYIDKKNSNVRVWTMPYDAIHNFIETPSDDITLSFMEEFKDERY
jgi:hypothetical protein